MDSNFFEKEITCLTEDILKKCEKQTNANESYASLLYSYGLGELTKYDDINEAFVGKTELTSEDYPDYYGGAYINNDGELTIYITEEVETCKDKIEAATGKKNCIMKRCRYSYKDMLKVKEEIEKHGFDSQNEPIFKNITAYGVSDMENFVFVEMDDLTPEQITLFKEKVSDSELIIFRYGEKAESEVTIRAGEGVCCVAGSSSNGFRARIAGVAGFIMSGHGAGGKDVEISRGSDSSPLGKTTHWQWGGSVDAAFVEVNSNVVLSNEIMNTTDKHAPFIAPSAVNTMVFQSGITTGLTSGIISAVNINVQVGNIPMTGLVRATYASAAGDSGGIVYTLRNGQRPILGNHVASGPHFGQVSNIIRTFGVSLF